MDKTKIAQIIEDAKLFDYTIIWGCSFLGRPIGRYLLDRKVNIVSYWDIRFSELIAVDDIKVVRPFTCSDKERTLVIICIGNNILRAKLRQELTDRGYPNVMPDDLLRVLYPIALSGDYTSKNDVSPEGMSPRERMEAAISYAVKSDFKIWDRQHEITEYLRMAESICLIGGNNFWPFFKLHGIENNGISHVRYFCNPESDRGIGEVAGVRSVAFGRLQEISPAVAVLQDRDIRLSEELDRIGMEHFFCGDIFLNVFSEHYRGKWFLDRKESILAAYDLLEDSLSRDIYVEVLCNRIAPHLATKSFAALATAGEYFTHGIFKLTNDECLVDAGAYNGDSIKEFIEAVNGEYEKIYAFEMDPDNYNNLKKNMAELDSSRIVLRNQGLSDRNARIVCDGSGAGVHISGNQGKAAEVVRLDDAQLNMKVTFIKMDIEGSEMAALDGARRLITEQRPKLAISAYHKLPDLWEVPLYLKALSSDYRLFLRHHSKYVWDTDIYAY